MIVLITGANRGIGLELARQYVANGDTVLSCARNPARAEDLQTLKLQHTSTLFVHALDVENPASVAQLAFELRERPIDILINNAGVYGGEQQSPGDTNFDEWLHTFSVNTLGPMRVFQALKPNLQLGQARKIVAITSRMGSTALHGGGAFIYRSSKAALNNVVKGLSKEPGLQSFTFVAIHPGWVRTDMGGTSATLSPEQSVTSIRRLIAGLVASQSGSFLDWDGTILPW